MDIKETPKMGKDIHKIDKEKGSNKQTKKIRYKDTKATADKVKNEELKGKRRRKTEIERNQ
jgi:aspartate carbamoyltransferase regulatory subunit